MSRLALRADLARRARTLVTPEGLALPLTVGSRGARAGALILDLMIIVFGLIAIIVLFSAVGLSLFDIGAESDAGPIFNLLSIVMILVLFLARYGYFLWFELGPRGATPGKRTVGLRVAARDGGRLTAEMVIARNLVRDIEVILPIAYLLVIAFGGGSEIGVSGWALFAWLMLFLLFPFFNKDALRAGDLVAGTWVVETPKAKLEEAMSLAPDRSRVYHFGEQELSVYGEHELQVLESVLRQDRPEALQEVAAAIARKIGWEPGAGDEREFLEAFYAALRGHLESRMRFGERKLDKFS
ncbi:RDD family protein [Aurantiacibacter poecillastricola]|uniref:RDD family protein n=1 Tax=Aurantiacibacter poecillastricola TaxID=3064385 RepID=UPI00273D0B4C|nr:RDD family protein [Aurantiacibacter sp. 219JJ12-13]MDP5261088.1 RDD family protein [Aurantiacibacter sp. 219JJ12-13]